MTIFDQYLFKAVVSVTLLVLFVLLALAGFVDFISEIDNIGEGSFGVPEALIFMALGLSQRAFEMLPSAVLLGALLGLGNLAAHSELIVMRASGVSVPRLARSILIAGLFLMVVAAALGEYIAPPSERYARQYKVFQMSDELDGTLNGESFWAKDGDVIVNVQQLIEEDRVDGVYLFTFNGKRELESIAKADTAGFTQDARWQLDNYRETVFGPDQVSANTQRRIVLPSAVNPQVLALSVVDADALTGRGLLRYIRYLKRNGLDPYQYQVALWQRLATTLSVPVMALLALPFVLGGLRAAGAGARMLIGVLIGVGYTLGSRTFANTGEVYGLEPALTALLPLAVLAVIAILAVAQSR